MRLSFCSVVAWLVLCNVYFNHSYEKFDGNVDLRHLPLHPQPQLRALAHTKGNGTTTPYAPATRRRYGEWKHDGKYLSCSEIANLKIVRLLGEGKRKAAYEVRLPWGARAVLKRCTAAKCVSKDKIPQEGRMLRGLYEQYGDAGALRYFGGCYRHVPL